jgi:hypothetical protein
MIELKKIVVKKTTLKKIMKQYAFSEHYCQIRASLLPKMVMVIFPMKAFWNIENIEDVILLCCFLLTMNRDEDIAHESFSFKIILRSLW